MPYILPQALCALLWWMAAHPDEVGALASELEAAAVVAEIVLHREPLGDGEVLEYVWRDYEDAEPSERLDERHRAKEHNIYNLLRVRNNNIIIANKETYANGVFPPKNSADNYIALELGYEDEDGYGGGRIFILEKSSVVDAFHKTERYKSRITQTGGSAAFSVFHRWHNGLAHVSHACCGMDSHWLIDPKTMEHSEPTLLEMHTTKDDKSGGKFRFSAPTDVGYGHNIVVYSMDMFYDIISNKGGERLARLDALGGEGGDESERRAYISLRDGELRDGMLTATVEVKCYDEERCEGDPKRRCMEDEPSAVIREQRSWTADRPHVILYDHYFKRCLKQLKRRAR